MLQPKLYSLKNGIPVIIDSMPYVESATIGVYVKNGSRNESVPSDFGISHLLEHMAFKGTKTRTARDIALTIENIGGDIGAYTAQNRTAYFASVPAARRDVALDILSDILFNSTFPADELAREKSVVISEIKMYHDMPDAIIGEAMARAIFRGGMQHDIAGTARGVNAITREQLSDFFHTHYSPKNSTIIISGGGLEDSKQIINELNKYFGDWAGDMPPAYAPSICVKSALVHNEKNGLEHNYFKIIWPTRCAILRESLENVRMFLTTFGGGMGSRLFQKIREELGLVYGIGAYSIAYEDVGIAIIDGQTEPEKMDETMHAIAELVRAILDGTMPVTDAEIARARELTRGGIIMGLEASSNRADFFASRSVQFGGVDNIENIIARNDAITADVVNSAARELFANAPSIITLGDSADLPLAKWQELFIEK